MSLNRSARAGRPAECNRQSIQETPQHLHCESTGSMPDLKGWRHHTTGERGSAEARGGWQVGEAAEGGPSSPVDGKRQGAWVG